MRGVGQAEPAWCDPVGTIRSHRYESSRMAHTVNHQWC
jgi:hypothetical protein